MGILISRTRFQFLHKLLEFVGCSCFFIAFMSYCVIAKKNVYNSNLEIGNAYALYIFIVS